MPDPYLHILMKQSKSRCFTSLSIAGVKIGTGPQALSLVGGGGGGGGRTHTEVTACDYMFKP